jgi:fermentation-respiration switch protein FrsA (DUF1100 family)
MMADDSWTDFFLRHDPAATMRRVRTPVLILTGARDQQAPGRAWHGGRLARHSPALIA